MVDQIEPIREQLIALFRRHGLAPQVAESALAIQETAQYLPVDPAWAVRHIVERQVTALLPARSIRYDSERISDPQDYVHLVEMLAALTEGEWRPQRVTAGLDMHSHHGESGIAWVGWFDDAGAHISWTMGQLDDWVSDDFFPKLNAFAARALPGRFVRLPTGDQSHSVVYLLHAAALELTALLNDLVRSAETLRVRGPGDEPENPVDPKRVRHVPVYPERTTHTRGVLTDRAERLRGILLPHLAEQEGGERSAVYPAQVIVLLDELSPVDLEALQNIYAHLYDASLVEDIQMAVTRPFDRYRFFQRMYPSHLHLQGSFAPTVKPEFRYFTRQPPLDNVAQGQIVTYTVRPPTTPGGRTRSITAFAVWTSDEVILNGVLSATSPETAAFTFAEPGSYEIVAEQSAADLTLAPQYYCCWQEIQPVP